MPMAYAKCSHCGQETREIVPIDKTGYTQQPNGSWRFNPNAPKTKPKAHKVKCSGCGKLNNPTDDPKAVKSFLQLNWLEG
jgi:hypothetical protein